ncbi:orotidine 5'-phosphate decarboxylase [Metallosphaera tengchongensis]|uniref:Orotidine 5'-phosphate decarboxylase n=1 Tax=Metallosphaera tengchongensis TaxID=1532350 RepID=A0A6N0NW16_9CREN|nr:orotidine 5'-phosphate decarboxylase / HUMPS family protein [Metallosphaera tengchongensis]QKQ99557.1 orotidine 5'-phosphate decarboxylase [Metallosphaera tengchongensis]
MRRIILSIDEPISKEKLVEMEDGLAAVKVGWPLILSIGVDGVNKLLTGLGLKKIFDLKLADIDNTMNLIVEKLKPMADAFIAHSFIGVRGSLGSLNLQGRELYLVLSMSHPGWNESFYPYLREVAMEVNPEGLVAPATRPSVIRKVREDFPTKVVISPGVGAQGAEPGDAICSGADYEIMGRAIYLSERPVEKLREITKKMEDRLYECKRAKDRPR